MAASSDWPRPFYDQPWRGERQDAAHVLWHWHLALHARATGTGSEAAVASARQQAESVCERFHLPAERLSDSEAVLAQWQPPVRFAEAGDLEAFTDAWAGSLAHLLAGLGGAGHVWQQEPVTALARALFWTGRLMLLPDDLRADRLFIPLADLDAMGASVDALKQGERSRPVKKVIWKQTIRARDALARALPLVHELDRPARRAFRQTWMGTFELLNQIERREGDLWSQPIRLSPWQRAQVVWQARFARTTFRK